MDEENLKYARIDDIDDMSGYCKEGRSLMNMWLYWQEEASPVAKHIKMMTS